MKDSELINRFAKAIARKEDFFVSKSLLTISQRLNNPGCLPHWKDREGTPYPEINGYVQFPECQRPECNHQDHPAEEGWRALRAQCKINVFKRELTFLEFFAGKRGVYRGFCPDSGDFRTTQDLRKHNAAAYAREMLIAVAGSSTELTISTPVKSLLGSTADGRPDQQPVNGNAQRAA